MIVQRPLKVALKPPSFSAPCVRAGRVRIETNRLIIIGDGARKIAHVHARDGAIEVAECISRREAHDHVEIGDCAGKLPCEKKRQASIDKRIPIFLIQGNRLFEIGDCAVKFLLIEERRTPQIVEFGRIAV